MAATITFEHIKKIATGSLFIPDMGFIYIPFCCKYVTFKKVKANNRILPKQIHGRKHKGRNCRVARKVSEGVR
jgi:hypothetical protein